MRLLVQIFIIAICLLLVRCSEECSDCPPDVQRGNLGIKSTPPGARIFLEGIDTGQDTPDTLLNLVVGNYNVSLGLQYYDTLSFTANVYQNVTTSEEFTLEDGLPPVDIFMDYATFFGGDSVRFSMEFNQDLLMDSIVVRRPIDSTGIYEYITFLYNKQLLSSDDQFGTSIQYYLPKPGSGPQFFSRIRTYNYFFYIYGQKAYGEQTVFYLAFTIGV